MHRSDRSFAEKLAEAQIMAHTQIFQQSAHDALIIYSLPNGGCYRLRTLDVSGDECFEQDIHLTRRQMGALLGMVEPR